MTISEDVFHLKDMIYAAILFFRGKKIKFDKERVQIRTCTARGTIPSTERYNATKVSHSCTL